MTHASDDNLRNALQAIADRYFVSLSAAESLLAALVAGHGTQAQFNHPELGGMGQWSRGGMLMIGDMFNHNLKATVAGLCADISDLAIRVLETQPSVGQHQSQYQGDGTVPMRGEIVGSWWPKELGNPSATGAQNDMRYALFPASRRLAVYLGGKIAVYDTKDHVIGGFSQQQSGDQSVSFSSQYGQMSLSQLDEVSETTATSTSSATTADAPPLTPAVAEVPAQEPPPAMVVKVADVAKTAEGDIFDMIERLAALHAKGILTDEEFAAKKTELLARL